MKIFSYFFLSGLAISIILPNNAHAYLDPGTGSALLQGLVAILAGAVVVGKIYWHRLLQFFGIGNREKKSTESQNKSVENDD